MIPRAATCRGPSNRFDERRPTALRSPRVSSADASASPAVTVWPSRRLKTFSIPALLVRSRIGSSSAIYVPSSRPRGYSASLTSAAPATFVCAILERARDLSSWFAARLWRTDPAKRVPSATSAGARRRVEKDFAKIERCTTDIAASSAQAILRSRLAARSEKPSRAYHPCQPPRPSALG